MMDFAFSSMKKMDTNMKNNDRVTLGYTSIDYIYKFWLLRS